MVKRNYDNWSKEELIREVGKLEKKLKKQYGLAWEDKPEEVATLCKQTLPVLIEDKTKEIVTDNNKPTNILIEGDNYHALSVLNYTHAKKIDVIYIDPPYNTGARDWKYNNNFVDGEDPYRHTNWLSFMQHRLTLAKNLLNKNGIICVTIDDYEMPRLWLLMEKIFGANNHLGTVTIRNYPSGRKTKRKMAQIHEYALFFGKPNSAVANLERDLSEKSHKYVQDKDGSWYCPTNLRKQGVDSTAVKKNGEISHRFYPIYYNPKTKVVSTKKEFEIKILPIDPKGEKRIWRRGKEVIDEMYKKGEVWVQETKHGPQVYYKFRGGINGEPPKTIWFDSKFSASEYGTSVLHEIFGKRELFQFPKSVKAVEECIKVSSSKENAIILDFFAGSGTTAQAVLNLNDEDDGSRQFILCTNNENNICTDICYPRITKVIKGYKRGKEEVKGLGGNLKYFKTNFVDAKPSDRNKKKLVDKSTEMLCLKEDCFDEVKKGSDYRMFKDNEDKYLGIIYDDDGIEPFKKEAKKIKKKFVVYVFSLDESAREEEFEDMADVVRLKPIPAVILNVYKRIFK